MKIIRDTVHGDISLTDEELLVVDTPEFQRMRYIHQLGTSYLVFPGAHHTRFEHSLGTCWLTKQMMEHINQSARAAGLPEPIRKEEARLLSMAGLLHDITHIPFGHTFEDERRILPAHDKSRERLHYFLFSAGLGKVLEKLGLRDKLLAFFTGEPTSDATFGRALIGGPICSDLLDYLKRDAFYCGLPMAYDDRLFRYLQMEGGVLYFNLFSNNGFRQDAWSELVNLLRIRYHLTERVYFHHAKMASGAMLSRFLEAALAKKVIAIPELYQLGDEALLHLFQTRAHKVKAFAPLMEAFRSRRLYKRVYMVAKDPFDPEVPSATQLARFHNELHMNENGARTHIEKRLAKHLGIPASAIILYAPDTRMRLKEAKVPVRMNTGPLVSLADMDHPELRALNHRHQALWKSYLFMDPQYENYFLKASRFLEAELGLPNQLELFNKGQMTFQF